MSNLLTFSTEVTPPDSLPASPIQIQRQINQCIRQLKENAVRRQYLAALDSVIREEIAELERRKEDALNAGILRSRAGVVLAQAEGILREAAD